MRISLESDTYDFIRENIRHWVGRNFGSQELEEPSWNIDELSSFLANKINKREETIKNLTDKRLVVYTTLPSQRDRSALVASILEKIRRCGGSNKKIIYGDVERVGGAVRYEITFDMELPSNDRFAERGMLRWLERQRDGSRNIDSFDMFSPSCHDTISFADMSRRVRNSWSAYDLN